jgi:hypothetical protein
MTQFKYNPEKKVLEEQAPEKPKWDYGFPEDGPSDSLLQSAHDDFESRWTKYEAHIASLRSIPVAPVTENIWPEGLIEESAFEVRDFNSVQGENHYAFKVAYPIQAKETGCSHESLIDTGVGCYHCPQCNKVWSYKEWENGIKPADPLDEKRFSVRDMMEWAEFIANGNYEYNITSKKIVEWNEVEDPQHHDLEDGPEVYSTYELLQQHLTNK